MEYPNRVSFRIALDPAAAALAAAAAKTLPASLPSPYRIFATFRHARPHGKSKCDMDAYLIRALHWLTINTISLSCASTQSRLPEHVQPIPRKDPQKRER